MVALPRIGPREDGVAMNRAIFLLLAGFGVAVAGCAADVQDPVPPTPAEEVQRDPPEQVLKTELRDPLAALLAAVEIDHRMDHVRAKELLVRLPGPEPGP
jgi:hypothetical protein